MIVGNIAILDYKGYSLEHLTNSVENLDLISKFSASNNAYGLENYLKTCAEHDEFHNYGRTYFIKDAFTKELTAYFTLRNGLIVLQDEFQEKEQKGKFKTIPAVELSNFAVNENYKNNHPRVYRLGHMFFYVFILPLVKEIQKYSGINSLYIYALPNDRLIEHYGTMGFSRLPADKEKFVHFHVKPEYDEGCIFMYQTV